MKIPSELKELARLFPAPLFVVGGAVRDDLLGYGVHDYDLSSSLTAEEVVFLLKDTSYKVTPHSLKLGTLGIKVGEFTMEYTAFRKDSYSLSGAHAPSEVEFNCSQEEDARRRDFTVNALYYDILGEKIVDLVGGLDDLKERILKTPREPEEVIKEDALRILRLVRFSSALGFSVEEETQKVVKERASSLQEIAVERIREEFEKILVADTVNGVKDAQIKGIEMMVDLGIMQYVVPEFLESIGVCQNPKYHIYDVYHHSLETVRRIKPELRRVAFFHDIAKPRSIDVNGHMRSHAKKGAEMTKGIMTRLLYPNRLIERDSRLVEAHMFDVKCNESVESVREFVLRYFDLIDDLLELKQADYVAHKLDESESPSAKVIRQVRNEMLENNVAFSIKELPIGGTELIELGVEPAGRAKVLNDLLLYGATLGRGLSKEESLEYINSIK